MARAKEYSVESMGVSPDKVHLARVTVWLARCACASLAMRLWLLGSVSIGLLGRMGIGRYISFVARTCRLRKIEESSVERKYSTNTPPCRRQRSTATR